MNEIELATIAFQRATLVSRNVGHRIAAGQLLATLVIGFGPIATVRYGIRAMQRASERRAREQDQRHTEAMDRAERQHAEAMRALEALITRTAATAAGGD